MVKLFKRIDVCYIKFWISVECMSNTGNRLSFIIWIGFWVHYVTFHVIYLSITSIKFKDKHYLLGKSLLCAIIQKQFPIHDIFVYNAGIHEVEKLHLKEFLGTPQIICL